MASDELERLHPLKAVAEAHSLPIRDLLTEYQQTLQGIQSSASDDCVRILTETGPIFQETRERVRHLREALDDAALDRLRQARTAVSQVWPRLAHHVADARLEEAVGELKAILTSEEVVDRLGDAARKTKSIMDAYRSAYLDLFDRRAEAYRRAIEDIKGRPEWAKLPKDAAAEAILAPLTARLGSVADREAVSGGEALGRSTPSEMESDLAAVEGLKSAAVKLVQDRTHQEATERPIRRIRVSGLFDRPIESQEDLDAALQRLRDSLQKLIDEGTAIILE